MAVLVTGAAGFIGMAVSARLLARGEEVIGIDNLNDYYPVALKQSRLAELALIGGDRFQFLPIDFSDNHALTEGLAGLAFDRIVHLGAQAGVRYSIDNPRSYIQSNLVGHANMLELARNSAVGHFVYASSSSVYGGNTTKPFRVEDRVDRPISLYAATKRADELISESYAHLYRFPQTGLRFFTVYGPWGRPDMAMWKFTAAILGGRPIDVYNGGDMRRDFTYVDDVVTAVIAALDRPPADDLQTKPGGSNGPHAIYNVGNNRTEELMRLIAVIEESCGTKAMLNMLPMQDGDVPETFADITLTARNLGFEPITTIEIGVPQFVKWFRSYHSCVYPI